MATATHAAETFTTELCSRLPGQVRSVVLFGSAAAGDFVPGASDYDLLVVLDQVREPQLNALSPLIQRWYRQGNPLPLVFAANEVADSVDAFAPEFLEMKQSRRVLFGSDPIENLVIDSAPLRMHLERELKGKLLALRNRYSLAAGHRREIWSLLTASFSTILSLFRLALRLYQPEVPTEKMDALRVLSTYVSFSREPFLIVDEVRRKLRRPASVDVHQLFHDYCQSVETVVSAVDRHLHSES